jgi:hypothetical protein
MRWLKTIIREAFGLFVDDGWLALASIAWLAVVWRLLPLLPIPSSWHGVILFLGLAAILLASVLHRCGRRATRRPPA